MPYNSRETIDKILSAIRRGDAEGYASFFAEDADLEHPLAPEPLRGRAPIRDGEQALFNAFSDIDIDIRSLTTEQERVVVEVVLRATNTGAIDLGQGELVPATGRQIEVSAAWIFEFGTDGLVASERDYFDTTSLMAQLGIGE